MGFVDYAGRWSIMGGAMILHRLRWTLVDLVRGGE